MPRILSGSTIISTVTYTMSHKQILTNFKKRDTIKTIEALIYFLIDNKTLNHLHHYTWFDDMYGFCIDNMREYISYKSGYIYKCYYDRELQYFKVGKTKQLPEQRMKQLNCESIIGSILLDNYWKVFDCSLYEREIHRLFDSHNVERVKEHFKMNSPDIDNIVNQSVRNTNYILRNLVLGSDALQEYINTESYFDQNTF